MITETTPTPADITIDSPPTEDTDTSRQLVAAATAIRDWQASRPTRIVDEALVKRFPALGSTKTYKRLLTGDTAELRTEVWLGKYRAVLAQIDAEEAAVTGHDEIYEDLTPTTKVRAALQNLIRSRGLERLVLIEGGTGSGKTSALRCVEDQWKGSCIRVEATEGWRSFAAAMGDLAIACGVAGDLDKLPMSGAARLSRIITHLGDARRIVLIDEGHHMTSQVLNAIKTLINQTRALFVIAAQETIWRKLQASSWQEAKQLVLNRMRERVRLGAPSGDDVATYLHRRTGVWISEPVGRKIASEAGKWGDFAALRRLAEQMLELPADDRGDQSALECFAGVKDMLA